MQLIDFALIGLTIATPRPILPAVSKEAATCPDLNGDPVFSSNGQAYKLDCGKWVDAGGDAVLRIVTTNTGFKGCLTACDRTPDCAISEYTASNEAQTKGSCALFKKGVPIKPGSDNSWTLATKIGKNKKPSARPAPKPKKKSKPKDPLARPGKDDKFGLLAIRSGSPVQNEGVTAAHGRFSIGGKQDASCDKYSDTATFYIKDGQAYLYSTSATPQQLWVDRSGMGSGITGYTVGAQPAPRNAERKGFAISDDGYLEFDGTGTVACPRGNQAEDAGWSIWFTGADQPGNQQGCLPVALRATKSYEPVSCSYTSDSN